MPLNYAVASGRGLLGDDAIRHGLDCGRGAGSPMLSHYMKTGESAPKSRSASDTLESVMSTMGKARDLDASIDRINDPPPQLWPTLFAIRAHCETHSINLHSLFWEAGAKANGIMPPPKFNATLKDHVRHPLQKDTIEAINQHYGLKWLPIRNEHESIAWKDFCEDVSRTVHRGNGYELLAEPE